MRTLRRRLGALALLGPALWTVGGDLLRRFGWMLRFDPKHGFGYAATALLMAAVWAGLLHLGASRRGWRRWVGGALFVVLFTLPTGVQPAMYALFRMYCTLDTGLYVDSIPWVVFGTLPVNPRVVFSFASALLAALALLFLARRAVRPRRRSRWSRQWRVLLALPALALPFSGSFPVSYQGFQSTSPDLIYYEGISYVLADRIKRHRKNDPFLVRMQRRSPERVPSVKPTPERPRNVFVVLQEAQRADVTCSAYTPLCDEANIATNHLLPNRLPLLQMRSQASSTFVSIFTLFSGLDPVESRGRVASAPLTWDYAHAAGYDTAFWTSQTPMFQNYRLFFQDLPLTRWCMSASIDPGAEILAGADDQLLTDRVIKDFDQLEEPFFAVAQYSNIHHPRIFDRKRAPFQPTNRDKRPEFRNFYKNVVYLSDRAVARLLQHVRLSPAGPRTVIVFTSDHGEALFEHRNENFHSSTTHEEEIRVPAFIDAPPGTLSPDEELNLRKAKNEPVFHSDLAATMLDLLGLWDTADLSRFRERMIGHPLTRAERTKGPVPLTNVSWSWEYHLPNWGMIDWPYKIFAGHRATKYQCFDLRTDPRETRDLGEGQCPKLVARANELFRIMPATMKDHLTKHPEWGIQ